LYVNQDYVSQRELAIGLPHYSLRFDWPTSIDLSKREKQIGTLLVAGISREEICKELKITRKTLRNVLCKLRKKWDAFNY
jgi:DNA-binding CsgD family transcriptional regulator